MINLVPSYSFNDILIQPRYTDCVSRKNISLNSKLTKTIELKLPIISSPMDTVTEDQMAIAMALNGGLGIIHRYCSIEHQKSMVEKVKRYLNFMISNPYTIQDDATILQYENMKIEKNVSSFIVVNKQGQTVGIITKRDHELYKIKQPEGVENAKVKDVMTPLEEMVWGKANDAKSLLIDKMIQNKVEKLPILNVNNEPIGLVTLQNLYRYKMYSQNYSLDKQNRLLVGAAIGAVGDYKERAKELVDAGCDILCIDVANGYHKMSGDCIKYLKSNFPHVSIMAGNVCNKEGFEYLAAQGADTIRVGIGNGSICTTRLVTGIGKGQFTAIKDCVEIARKYGVTIISDGGHLGLIGNKFKALAVGSHAVMLGRSLAATMETPGKVIFRNGKRVKYFRGMASEFAMISKFEKTNTNWEQNQTAEGVDTEIELKGPVSDTLNQIRGGICSGLSYVGCDSLEMLKSIEDKIEYVLVSSGGQEETNIRVKPK